MEKFKVGDYVTPVGDPKWDARFKAPNGKPIKGGVYKVKEAETPGIGSQMIRVEDHPTYRPNGTESYYTAKEFTKVNSPEMDLETTNETLLL